MVGIGAKDKRTPPVQGEGTQRGLQVHNPGSPAVPARVTVYTREHTCWSRNLAALLGLCLRGGLCFFAHVCIGRRACGARGDGPYPSVFVTKHTDMTEAGELGMEDMVTDLADTELGSGFRILCLLNAV